MSVWEVLGLAGNVLLLLAIVGGLLWAKAALARRRIEARKPPHGEGTTEGSGDERPTGSGGSTRTEGMNT